MMLSDDSNGEKTCPFCAEKIKSAAIKCRYCGSDLVSPSRPPYAADEKPCPECRKPVKVLAVRCSACGCDLTRTAAGTGIDAAHPVRPALAQPVRATGNWAWYGCGGIIAFVIIAFSLMGLFPSGPTQNSPAPSTLPVVNTTQATVPDDTPQLKAGKWHWKLEDDYAIAEGTVTNVSDEPLKNVEAVVSYKTKSGDFITTGEALIELNPILPGQTCAWKTMTTSNPAMENASVEFKDLMGGSIPAKQ